MGAHLMGAHLRLWVRISGARLCGAVAAPSFTGPRITRNGQGRCPVIALACMQDRQPGPVNPGHWDARARPF